MIDRSRATSLHFTHVGGKGDFRKERNFWTNFLALFDLVVTLVALTQCGARNLMAGVLWDALAHTALAHPI